MVNATTSVVTTSGHSLPRYLRGRSRDVYLRAYQGRRHAVPIAVGPLPSMLV